MKGNPDSGIWIFLLVEYAESWAFESGIQLKESGMPLTIEIQNPGSTDKDWNQYLESVIHSAVESRIQNCLGLPYMGTLSIYLSS